MNKLEGNRLSESFEAPDTGEIVSTTSKTLRSEVEKALDRYFEQIGGESVSRSAPAGHGRSGRTATAGSHEVYRQQPEQGFYHAGFEPWYASHQIKTLRHAVSSYFKPML